jgi:SAM-dependent methyltransferase
MRLFYEAGDVPAHSCVLLDDQPTALAYPRATIRLMFCGACGFIQNSSFDPSLIDYGQDCEESQAFSGTFQAFATEAANELVDRFDLHDKIVLEVGAGKGDFLALLCRLGPNKGIGIDPGYRKGRAIDELAGRAEMIVDFYSDRYAHLTADLVVCRHTLEHIADVADFTRLLGAAAAATPGGGLFVEVPDTTRVLTEHAFWDVYHEHCSYFTRGSLARLLTQSGISPERVWLGFENQYLLAVAGQEPTGFSTPDDIAKTAGLVDGFREGAAGGVASWKASIADWRRDGKRVVMWGGGSKAITFAATIGAGVDVIADAVDINPFKQGKFLPGTGQEVVAPESLVERPPDVVIVMNSIYVDEIRAQLADLSLTPEVVSL